MKRIPTLYNSEEEDKLLILSTRRDKVGNIFYYVEYVSDGSNDYVRFEHLSSALDFIHSYFR